MQWLVKHQINNNKKKQQAMNKEEKKWKNQSIVIVNSKVRTTRPRSTSTRAKNETKRRGKKTT